MSDGPFKSLNLQRCWKRVARFAENDTHSSEEVAGTIKAALSSEFRKQVSEELRSALQKYFDNANSLIPEDPNTLVIGLKQLAENEQLANLVIDSSRRFAGIGGTLEEAVADSLLSWGARHVRSITEHYLREGEESSAKLLESRASQACIAVANVDLAKKLLNYSHDDESLNFRRNTDLNDGPKL